MTTILSLCFLGGLAFAAGDLLLRAGAVVLRRRLQRREREAAFDAAFSDAITAAENCACPNCTKRRETEKAALS